ncbi:putative oxidoreductase, FAD-binding [Sclerotinia borealis F-4128]|uniref:Putative oxidoreductase, FAD-binding n=1 Tax=Sclerotinia borealis (strain F-4128) TaxID=1432307 RepID=W9CMC7_SCLBF|nr:putative oxidoreductase, FAD-binding [Sclerotinia borealis F-4128]
MSGREGLVCDNVGNYEVVLADGSIVNANRTENRDLWIALKGGSSNFEIATRFNIRTFQQGDFNGGVIVSPKSTVDTQFEGYVNLDPYAALIMSVSWNQIRNSFSVFTNLQYTKNDTSSAVLQPFIQALPQYLDTMRVSNLTDFAKEASRYAAPGLRNQSATTTFGEGLESLNTVYNIWNSSISAISSINGTNWAMVTQPFPTAFVSSSTEANSLGLSTSSNHQTLFLLSYSWASAEDDHEMTAAAQKLVNDIEAAVSKVGVANDFK